MNFKAGGSYSYHWAVESWKAQNILSGAEFEWQQCHGIARKAVNWQEFACTRWRPYYYGESRQPLSITATAQCWVRLSWDTRQLSAAIRTLSASILYLCHPVTGWSVLLIVYKIHSHHRLHHYHHHHQHRHSCIGPAALTVITANAELFRPVLLVLLIQGCLTFKAQRSLYVRPVQFYVLPTQLNLCVLCGSENIQRLFHCTALTDWFL